MDMKILMTANTNIEVKITYIYIYISFSYIHYIKYINVFQYIINSELFFIVT